jgi:pyruvate,water dikinase
MQSKAVATGYGIPGVDLVMYLKNLSSLDLRFIDRIRAVYFEHKGFSSHIEVACRIKGIPLIRVVALDFVEGDLVDLPADLSYDDDHLNRAAAFDGKFQVSIFDATDLGSLNQARLDTIFVRFEYLMYRAAAEQGDHTYEPRDLTAHIRHELGRILDNLDSDVNLILRLPDIRSDDALLADLVFDSKESNPELGDHGTRAFLRQPAILRLFVDTIEPYRGQLQIACPFVTHHAMYMAFLGEARRHLPGWTFVPFVETPAYFQEVSKYGRSVVCIGLKDMAQFYFAADRGNPITSSQIDYLEDSFFDAVTKAIAIAGSLGAKVSCYQDIVTLGLFQRALSPTRWIPSVTATDYRVLTSTSLLTKGRRA